VNIFVVHSDPALAARDLCDQHAVKMPLESVQMLCTVLHKRGLPAAYKPSHARHPCTLWAESSEENWRWLIDHARALFEEYTRRYSKTHKSEAVLREIEKQKLVFPSKALTPFAQAMPDEYKDVDAVRAYRAYYRGEKASMARWVRRGSPPAWMGDSFL